MVKFMERILSGLKFEGLGKRGGKEEEKSMIVCWLCIHTSHSSHSYVSAIRI